MEEIEKGIKQLEEIINSKKRYNPEKINIRLIISDMKSLISDIKKLRKENLKLKEEIKKLKDKKQIKKGENK